MHDAQFSSLPELLAANYMLLSHAAGGQDRKFDVIREDK
jgi:hypothetical protein